MDFNVIIFLRRTMVVTECEFWVKSSQQLIVFVYRDDRQRFDADRDVRLVNG